MTFRYAEEKDAGLVLEFLKRLSEYEKAEEHLVSTASMLAEELGRENGARALFVMAEGLSLIHIYHRGISAGYHV